jgi:hypothetical protein
MLWESGIVAAKSMILRSCLGLLGCSCCDRAEEVEQLIHSELAVRGRASQATGNVASDHQLELAAIEMRLSVSQRFVDSNAFVGDGNRPLYDGIGNTKVYLLYCPPRADVA